MKLPEEDDLAKTIAALEYAAARRGLYLTTHALKRAKDVLRWELAGDREKALRAQKGTDVADDTPAATLAESSKKAQNGER